MDDDDDDDDDVYSLAWECTTLNFGTQCAYPRQDGQTELAWMAGYVTW